MARSGFKRSRYRSSNKRSIGHEIALQNIREAEELSKELGGTDQDVKQYFFSLSHDQLREILDEYENKFGSSARKYAEKTLPKWRNRSVHMSGMVAERLFKLMPPMMPLEAKFRLTESLWNHVGPSSNKKFYVGRDVDIEEISQKVKAHLEEIVTNYQIPSSMEARFNWLSQGDVGIKQKLLNHFRQLEKQLLSDALRKQLPVLLDHLNSERGELTTHTAQVLKVGKHEVQVIVDERVSGVSEISPGSPSGNIDNSWSWIWWAAGIVFVLWLLSQ